jgi:hypothetical protein
MKRKRYKHLKRSEINKHKLISIFLLFIIILALTTNIWFGDDYIVFSDIDFGINDKDYIVKMFGLFNDKFSSMNFFNLSRLVFIVPFYLLALIFSNWIPGFLLKSIIISLLLMSAFGMYKLCKKLLKTHFGKFENNYHYYGLIIPALFYALNPWVMLRIQHIFLLPGYACYPFVLNYFIDLFKLHNTENREALEQKTTLRIFWRKYSISKATHEDIATSIKLALFICIGSAAIHYFFFYVLTLLFLSIAILIHNMTATKEKLFFFKLFFKRHVTLWTITFLFCAYWVIPYLISMFATNIEPNNVNVVDTLNMFSRNSNVRNILYFVSYWWPMFDTGKFLDNAFWIGGGVFLFFIAYIILYRIKNHYYITLFTVSTILMIALATGVNTNLLDRLNIFIVTRIPVFGQIFRDPNKLVGPMAAFFAILISFAIDRYLFLLKREQFGKTGQIAFILVMLLAHYFYYRPFKLIFTEVYYAGTKLPQEYKAVNENFSTQEGKILWTPEMENMLLTNKISTYKWNMPEGIGKELGLMRATGNFHMYSSSKPVIFQHENNDGAVPYLYSFFQHLMDKTGGQHLDDLISWSGFNEVGFHNDVYGQDERQAFNYNVLNAQKNLTQHYKDDIFTLYNVDTAQKDVFAANRILYQSKALFSTMYMFDYTDALGITPSNTGLLWAQQKKQNIQTSNTDIIVGDNKFDLIMPLVDNQYFYYPFNNVNTGNPNTGWAKININDAEWNWLLKINGLSHYFQYDFSRGIVYTNVSNKLEDSSGYLYNDNNSELLGIKEVLNDFFTVSDPNMFKLTVFPGSSANDTVLQGEIAKGLPGNKVWQAATSKKVDVSSMQGGFLRIQSVLSGVNASSIHFKVIFYDDLGEELKVSYLTKSDDASDFQKVALSSDFYVPESAKTMVINILSFQDINLDTYFWIHDFKIYNIVGGAVPNTLRIPIKSNTGNSNFRILARVFTSEVGSDLKFNSGSEEITLSLNGDKPVFKWVDLGEMHIENGYVDLLPSDGLTVIGALAIIPVDEYDSIINTTLNKLQGYQTDFSLFNQDYTVDANFIINNMDNLRILPNTIDGNITLLDKGDIYKDIDIIREGDYNLSITANIPEESLLNAVISTEAGEEKIVNFISEASVERNFTGSHYKVIDEKNKYFLSAQPNINSNWNIKKYSFSKVHLAPGRYTIHFYIDSIAKNLVDKNNLGLIKEGDVKIPPELQQLDEELLYGNAGSVEVWNEKVNGVNTFKNSKTISRLWLIYSLNKIPVKKGELIGFRASVDTAGLKDIHGKLLWTDTDSLLTKTTYVPYNESSKDFFIYYEAPIDGYVLPTFLSRGRSDAEGSFSINNAELYKIDDFAKLEGSAIIPDMEVSADTISSVEETSFGKYEVRNTRYLIQNEAYNPIWRFSSIVNQEPVAINFIHNGFLLDQTDHSGYFIISPLIIGTYYLSLILSALSLITALILFRKSLRKSSA